MPKRRKSASGEGGIYERSDGRYDAHLSVRTSSAGPKVLRTTKSTRAEARRWLNRKKYERDEGTLPSLTADKITFGEYLDLWLRDSVEGTVARHTYRDYSDKVKKHLKPALGGVRLKDLTAAHLQSLYRQKRAGGLSARTVQYIHAVARKALEQAEAWDLVRKNVARHAKPPAKEHSERKVLDAGEVARFFEEASGDRFEALYVLALTTGMRSGELLGLKWADRGYVFPSSVGTAMSANNLRRRNLQPILVRAGLPRLTFHELRHTFATLMLSGGEHPKIVQAVLGHASITQTMDTYSHVVPAMHEGAAERLRTQLFDS